MADDAIEALCRARETGDRMANLDDERGQAFERALAYLEANRIDGAVVELGVHRGASLAQLAKLAIGRRVVGVDSFEGLPQPGPYDSKQFVAGQLRGCVADVVETFRCQAVTLDRVALRRGAFSAFAPISEPVALVHLDCDLYQSAVDGLALVDPVDGAVVLIDDYYCHRARPDLGVRRAWTEWLDGTGRTATEFARYGWHGRAFVVHDGPYVGRLDTSRLVETRGDDK